MHAPNPWAARFYRGGGESDGPVPLGAMAELSPGSRLRLTLLYRPQDRAGDPAMQLSLMEVTSESAWLLGRDGVYMMGNFRDLANAEAFRDDIRKLGIKDAFVVPYIDGTRVTIEEALKYNGGSGNNTGPAGDTGPTGKDAIKGNRPSTGKDVIKGK